MSSRECARPGWAPGPVLARGLLGRADEVLAEGHRPPAPTHSGEEREHASKRRPEKNILEK